MSTYTNKVYSNFIFDYLQKRERQKTERKQKENSKPKGSQGLMSILEMQGQVWVMDKSDESPMYLFLSFFWQECIIKFM
jgi:hypothetical protein